MGRTFVHFACHSCSHCCTDVICLPTPWDVIRIVKFTNLHPRRFLDFIAPDEISDVADTDPTWLDVNGKRYLMALKRDPVRGCKFLDRKTRKCKIYSARPLLCRLYPFKIDRTPKGALRYVSLHKDVGCPRHRDGKVPVGPLWDLFMEDETHQQDYRDLVEVFNRKQYPGKKPEDFVEMFVVQAPAS